MYAGTCVNAMLKHRRVPLYGKLYGSRTESSKAAIRYPDVKRYSERFFALYYILHCVKMRSLTRVTHVTPSWNCFFNLHRYRERFVRSNKPLRAMTEASPSDGISALVTQYSSFHSGDRTDGYDIASRVASQMIRRFHKPEFPRVR